MTYYQTTLTDAVVCDKPNCGARIVPPDSRWPTYGKKFQQWFVAKGWSRWAGPPREDYCPLHGPSPRSQMRKVLPR